MCNYKISIATVLATLVTGAAFAYSCYNMCPTICFEVADGCHPCSEGGCIGGACEYYGPLGPQSYSSSGSSAVPYPSGIEYGQPSGWQSASEFTTVNQAVECAYADSVTVYDGPGCTGNALGTIRGVRCAEMENVTLPTQNPDCPS
jgi:hypothetical protein